MKRDEEQRHSIAIRALLEQAQPDQPVRKVAVLIELGPKFDRVSIEELTDALARHCSALGRRLSNEKDKSAPTLSDPSDGTPQIPGVRFQSCGRP